MRIVCLVPYRPDGGRRDAVWAWIQARWTREHPDYPVLTHPGALEGPFNRSAAINGASEAAGDWDLAFITDSDSFVAPNQARTALGIAESTGRLVVAHNRWRRLSERGTQRIMGGFNGSWEPFVEFDLHNTVSSALAVPRHLWDKVGGFDPGFLGWGHEDYAAWFAFNEIGGPTGRIDGDVWHLWHPTDGTDRSQDPQALANVQRMHRYAETKGHDNMLALIDELRA